MFGFNKKKRLIEGPIDFTAEVEIGCPAAVVFPLIDLSDPRFRHAQTGAQVRRVEGLDNRYEMIVEGFDDAVFQFNVLMREPNARYAIEARMEPQLFALVKSIETYAIQPIGDNACRVILTTSATFDDDLSDEDIAGEMAMMSQAVMAEMEKLKVLAEGGVEALKAMEEADEALDFEFDLGDLDIDWEDIEPEQ